MYINNLFLPSLHCLFGSVLSKCNFARDGTKIVYPPYVTLQRDVYNYKKFSRRPILMFIVLTIRKCTFNTYKDNKESVFRTVRQSKVPVRHRFHDPHAGSWSRLLYGCQIDFNFLGQPTQSVVLLIAMRLFLPGNNRKHAMKTTHKHHLTVSFLDVWLGDFGLHKLSVAKLTCKKFM